jgi:GrpB-like predicted nucleotidyltransferase (UPF0157 family)
MLTDDSLARAIVEEVRIVAHDLRWTEQFVTERDRLLNLLPDRFTAIEHIGSTAIPGLAAKPVIDIVAGVRTIDEADALLEPLCADGYVTSAEFNATLPHERWLMRHAFGRRTHHLHLVVFGGEQWMRRLQFRDALRRDAAIAARYEHLKRELAEQYRNDRDTYTQAKTALIHEVLTEVQRTGSARDRVESSTDERQGSYAEPI